MKKFPLTLAGTLLSPLVTFGGLTINLDEQLNPPDPFELNAANAPWLVAVLMDSSDTGSLAANQVSFALTAPGLSGSQFVDYWLFNYVGTSTELSAAVSSISGMGTPSFDNSLTGTEAGFSFDFEFDFPQPNSQRFNGGDSVTFIVSRTGGNLSVADFNVAAPHSSGGVPVWLTAAHINGTGPTGNDSDKIGGKTATGPGLPIPEPSALLMLITGLLGKFLIARRR